MPWRWPNRLKFDIRLQGGVNTGVSWFLISRHLKTLKNMRLSAHTGRCVNLEQLPKMARDGRSQLLAHDAYFILNLYVICSCYHTQEMESSNWKACVPVNSPVRPFNIDIYRIRIKKLGMIKNMNMWVR